MVSVSRSRAHRSRRRPAPSRFQAMSSRHGIGSLAVEPRLSPSTKTKLREALADGSNATFTLQAAPRPCLQLASLAQRNSDEKRTGLYHECERNYIHFRSNSSAGRCSPGLLPAMIWASVQPGR